MKKVLFAIAMIAVVALSGCTKPEPKIEKRLTACGDEWDTYVFTYGTDGKIATVNRNEGEKVWNFSWAGNVGTAQYSESGEAKDPYVFTLGDNGYLKTLANEWGDTWAFTYDAKGYLTKIERPDRSKVTSNMAWTDGNMTMWSRFKDDGSEQKKIQKFLGEENIGGVCPDFPDSDKCGVARWIFELGLCGKPSAHLLDQGGWEDSEAVAVYTYLKDLDGFVTKVNKVYDGGDPEIYEYVWEVVNAK